jgi:hypothetical protein
MAGAESDREAPELIEVLGEIRSRLQAIEIRLDSIEAQVETFAVVDLDSALDDVRAEVRSIKDEML